MLLKSLNISFSAANQLLLDNISLQVNTSEIVTIIGPNGAGKTTLLRVLLGLEKPTEGRVERKPGLRIGYMPQEIRLPNNLPISVKGFLSLNDRSPAAIRKALESTGIEHLENSALQAISGGEMQRAMLARAMLRKPELLVLDEPAQGVDLAGQNDMYRLIGQVREQTGCAVLMVSHDLHLVMANTDRVLCLNQHICCHGHPEQVSNDPAFRELFGELPSLALYTHHHDHHHDLHGDVVDCGGEQGGCNEGHHHA